MTNQKSRWLSQAFRLFLASLLFVLLPIGPFSTTRAFNKKAAPKASVTSSPAVTEKIDSVANAASPAVVLIRVYAQIPVYKIKLDKKTKPTAIKVGTRLEEISSGSGFFIRPDGYILTNNHVVSEPSGHYYVELNEKEKLEATIVFSDSENDLAILKIEGENFPTLALGDSSSINLGEDILGVGNALGIINDSISWGRISSISENIKVGNEKGEEQTLNNLLETNSKLYPGDSGGPLLNLDGQVIGVNVATTVGAFTSYFIPINTAKSFIEASGI